MTIFALETKTNRGCPCPCHRGQTVWHIMPCHPNGWDEKIDTNHEEIVTTITEDKSIPSEAEVLSKRMFALKESYDKISNPPLIAQTSLSLDPPDLDYITCRHCNQKIAVADRKKLVFHLSGHRQELR